MKFKPKKVFVLQDGKYIELSYQKFQELDTKNKKFLPLYGTLMEVSTDVYKEYYRDKRRQKYLKECAAENGEVSYHAFTTDEKNGEDHGRRYYLSDRRRLSKTPFGGRFCLLG